MVNPHILVYALVNKFVKCKSGTNLLSAGQQYSFRVDNPDHDFDFVYYWDDDTTPNISLGFFSTDHKAGYPQMVSERGTQGDVLRASFGGVNSLGGAGNWNPFGDPTLVSTGFVGDWEVCSWGATSLVVKKPC